MRWRELLLIYFMILLTIVECVIFYGIPRFRAPIEPLFILLAAGAMWRLTQKETGTLWQIFGRLLKTSTVGTGEPKKSEIFSRAVQTPLAIDIVHQN